MSIASALEEAAARIGKPVTALRDYRTNQTAFKVAVADEISDVLRAMKNDGLLGGLEDSLHQQPNLLISVQCEALDFVGNGAKSKPPSSDVIGGSATDAIVRAAQRDNIPVVHETFGGHHITISPHVKQPRKFPELALKALQSYAKSEGKEGSAQAAGEAAKRVAELTSGLALELEPRR